jgi:hypothetical protein
VWCAADGSDIDGHVEYGRRPVNPADLLNGNELKEVGLRAADAKAGGMFETEDASQGVSFGATRPWLGALVRTSRPSLCLSVLVCLFVVWCACPLPLPLPLLCAVLCAMWFDRLLTALLRCVLCIVWCVWCVCGVWCEWGFVVCSARLQRCLS